jgi:hypothetical protein
MKHVLTCCCSAILAAATLVAAQAPAPKAPPKSPPATETAIIAGDTITITYSSPRVNGRAGQIFSKDGLIGKDPSYPIWRAGANSATVLHTAADLALGPDGALVPKGDYSLWVDISDNSNWVLIVNKQFGQWGRTYDPKLDLVHIKMDMSAPSSLVEDLKYTITDLGGGRGSITLSWENKAASVLFKVK